MRIKHRRTGSEYIAGLANIFFHATSAHITVRADPQEWQHWEVALFRKLNGDQFRAYASGPRTVCQEKLPGTNLRKLLTNGNLTPAALAAAAKEIRRAHQLRSPEHGRLWSHGDLHMGNVIYDKTASRARLVDFEIVHDKRLPTLTRQADDLLVFLQDLIGLGPRRRWLPMALDFLDVYGRQAVIAKLRALLVVPHGPPALWWKIRTDYCSLAKSRRRVKALRVALGSYAKQREHTPRAISSRKQIS